jgi:uncharacterized repeat protein (TIGR01451 family)
VVDPGADGIVNAGDTVTYTFVVTNIGTVTVTNIHVTDPLPGLGTIYCPKLDVDPTLAPGENDTCTANYNITQADMDAGVIVNVVTVTADNTTNTTDTLETPIEQVHGHTHIHDTHTRHTYTTHIHDTHTRHTYTLVHTDTPTDGSA